MIGGPWLLGAALVAAAAPAPTSAATFAAPTPATLQQRLESARKDDPARRLVDVTTPLVGAPYVLNPLGEGSGPDPDPRLRYDAFDCTTFVETGLALTLSSRVDEVPEVLDLIRYRGGQASFENRRHFPAAEWLPDLMALGVLEDVTREVAGAEAEVAKKKLDLDRWRKRKRRILSELPPGRIPQGEFVLDVWPLAKANRGWRKIPPGTVLSVVRSDQPGVPVRVSHQGLVVEKDGELYLRHAADRVYHRVVDEPLGSFLARNAKYRKWPVTGIHLARVKTPPPEWRDRARQSPAP